MIGADEKIYDFTTPEIRLPRWKLSTGFACNASSPHGFTCTRVHGHSRRHAACGTRGQVIAVWS